jgi:hypothetical protein
MKRQFSRLFNPLLSLVGKHIFSLFVLSLISNFIIAQSTTVHGQVTDLKTKETMPYVNVQFEGTTIGATSDIEGNYFIETTEPVTKLKVSYVGYQAQTLDIVRGKDNIINVALSDATSDLKVVEIKAGGYTNRENPAVLLIRKVIANKKNNRKEALDYYSVNRYDKVEFSLNNITSEYRGKKMFKKFQFIFENVDTNKASGKVNLPIMIKETVIDEYYRKSPKSDKQFVRGEQISGLKSYLNMDGISDYIASLYQDINIYDDAISLATVEFVSPLSPLSPQIYRFYIQDTSIIKNTQMVHLYFAPRNKTDRAFQGHMWVALDSTYAVRKIELGIPKDVNLNWVNELQLAQEYDWFQTPQFGRSLMLTKDESIMDFGFFAGKSGRTILGKRVSSYKDYQLNKPIPDSFFPTGADKIYEDSTKKKDAKFWIENRHDTLTKLESGIYKMIDSIQEVPQFRRFMDVAVLLLQGYKDLGGFELGPWNTLYSYNPIEGWRGRIGGRTTDRFSERFLLDCYAQYGFRSERWNYYAGWLTSVGKATPLDFPMHQFKVWIQRDSKIPGQELQFINEDNILLSIKRGENNRLIYQDVFGLEYQREFRSGFSYLSSVRNVRQSPAGTLRFDYLGGSDTMTTNYSQPILNVTQFNLSLRYAPNEKFYQGKRFRAPILTKYPMYDLKYTTGIKGISGGNYDYHQLTARFEKIFYVSPVGQSDLIIEAGKIWGQVPYPLLAIHRANQTYSYQWESYNLMNFLEFNSDKYVSLNLTHYFQGLFFNKIPLLKKLKLREVITCKALWGSLEDKNNPNVTTPTAQNGLFKFATNEAGETITHTLNEGPYIEASAGIMNIFKFFRLDYVQRFNYLSHPNDHSKIEKWGLRVRIKFDF